MSGRRTLTALLITLLTIAACSSSTGPGAQGPPWIPPDSAYKVVENLEYAWCTQDIELVATSLDDAFEHRLLEEDWDDYNGDGIIDTYWDKYLELEFTEGTFNAADSIYMDISGTSEWPWSEDSSGQSLELQRSVYLEVHYPDTVGISSEAVVFICRPNQDGTWFIWLWIDQLEVLDENVCRTTPTGHPPASAGLQLFHGS